MDKDDAVMKKCYVLAYSYLYHRNSAGLENESSCVVNDGIHEMSFENDHEHWMNEYSP